MSYIDVIKDVHATIEDGDIRYWVNDSGPELAGTIIYNVPGEDVAVSGFVGLVDEHDGGMIAYGKPEIMENLADKLNKLHIIEELMHS